MKLVEKTNVPVKNPGDGLTSGEINAINGATNSCVDAVNYLLKNFCNVNQEVGQVDKSFSLIDALTVVPTDRRSLGMVVRFKSNLGVYVDVRYIGNTLEAVDWFNSNSWVGLESPSIIDGGEW